MSKPAAQDTLNSERKRSLALMVLCLGVLMITINTTTVNVALPTIRVDLHFSESSLVWIVNAYLATFGGFLILGGRLGDAFGRRRLFLIGVALFTLASLGCGLATSAELLIAARVGQGLSGAIVSAVALSQIIDLFVDETKRTKAVGIYVFVSTCGGSIGLLLGGVLTNALSWHWIFLINVPIGSSLCAMCITLLPPCAERRSPMRLDIAGAMTVTTSLMLAVYAIVKANDVGWSSSQTLGLLGSAGTLLALFVGIESRTQTPLLPLNLFRIRNLLVANIAGMLLAAALLSWNVTSALYLQLVLHLSPLQVGLVFLPGNLLLALMSLFVSPILIVRFGVRPSLVAGMLITGIGLALLSRASADANIEVEVLPAMLLVGLGAGTAYNPLFVCALKGVSSRNSGAASGIVTTSLIVGGVLGLAILANISAARTHDLVVAGTSLPQALNSGYQVVFLVGAISAILAALISALFVCKERH